MQTMKVSERRTCRALGQHRSTQRKVPRGRDDEAALTADLVALAERYGAYSDEAGRGFRFEAGRHSDAKPATVPI